MFKHVYLCHGFSNTKIKAFLSYCCILCSRISEGWFGYVTSMQKSSPLSLCSGINIELNSPTSHIQTWKRHMYVMANHYLFYPTVYQFWQHTEQANGRKPKHISIFKTNAFVVIKATQVIFKLQKMTVNTIKIKSCFHVTLAPKVYHLLHYCVQRSTRSSEY